MRSCRRPNNGLYVATSPDGKIYHVSADGTARDVLRSRRQVHLGARRRSQRATSSPRPATKASSTRSLPTGKGTRFYKTNSTNVVSLAVLRRRRSPRGNRITGPGLPDRRHGQGVRPARFAVQGNPRAAAGRRWDAVCGCGERLDICGVEDRSLAAAGTDRGRAPVPTVSTEITAISVVDAGLSQATTPVISRRIASKQSRSGLSHPAERAVGHVLGNRRGFALRPAG